jgi:ribosomal protein L13E
MKAKHPIFRMSCNDENDLSDNDEFHNREDTIETGRQNSQTFIAMTTWQKRDWQQFYELARRPWRRHRPPRPVYPSGLNRVAPAQGYSLSELDDAGVDLDQAESLGLPVDAGRIGVYGPNVTVLREFVRSSRHPL